MATSTQLLSGFDYSDSLAAGQVDSYWLNLTAGVTYFLGLDNGSSSNNLFFTLQGPNGEVLTHHPTNQWWAFTPDVSGTFQMSVDTTDGTPGCYSFSGGTGWIKETDTSTGITTHPFLYDYTGPVAGITGQFVDLNTDNINLLAHSDSVFLHSGSGEDAIQVAGGTNVLDGGTGSNFLVGGTGQDNFFIDDRAPVADIWSTIVNFHAGDSATIWGVTTADFSLSWLNNQGASGYTGLTGTFSAPGQPNAIFTLAGFTSADLTNGRLSISFGRTQDLPDLPGSNYMLIQAH